MLARHNPNFYKYFSHSPAIVIRKNNNNKFQYAAILMGRVPEIHCWFLVDTPVFRAMRRRREKYSIVAVLKEQNIFFCSKSESKHRYTTFSRYTTLPLPRPSEAPNVPGERIE